MATRGDVERYNLPAKLFHWLMAVLIIGLLCVGIYMADLPVGLDKLQLYGWHKSFGIIVLSLATLRLGWRVVSAVPPLPADLPGVLKLAARASHFVLYICMFAMPLSGWAMSNAAGFPVSVFGWFTLPDIAPPDKDLRNFYGSVHEWVGYGLIGLIALHAGAALWHHFVRKDGVLMSMWFRRGR